ncbi:hypothetical protein HAX54_017784 [Datura stramonium]|uniref:Uncharacterized protein n=1 Tax=Datura stramonium TaxID=4076 RepID=A0ABS8ULF8_DATST|nr:hypothetical protein [Datura stramonium]
MDRRRVDIGQMLSSELKEIALQTATLLPCPGLITTLCQREEVPTLAREEIYSVENQVANIIEMRDGTLIKASKHLSAPVLVGSNVNTEGFHFKGLDNITTPQLLDDSEALPYEPTSQEASPSAIVQTTTPSHPIRPTIAPRTIHLTRKELSVGGALPQSWLRGDKSSCG